MIDDVAYQGRLLSLYAGVYKLGPSGPVTAKMPRKPKGPPEATLHSFLTRSETRGVRQANTRQENRAVVQEAARRHIPITTGHSDVDAAAASGAARADNSYLRAVAIREARAAVPSTSTVPAQAMEVDVQAPAADGGASGGSRASGGGTQNVINGEPIWAAVPSKSIVLHTSRKLTFQMYGPPSPATNWSFAGAQPGVSGPQHYTNQAWHLLPTNFTSFYLDDEVGRICNNGTAWRILDKGVTIDQLKVYSYRRSNPAATEPTFEPAGESTVDLEIFAYPNKAPGRWRAKATGWDIDGTFPTTPLIAATLETIIDTAETGAPAQLPAVQFHVPETVQGGFAPLGGKSLIEMNYYPFNRYCDTVRAGAPAMDLPNNHIKGWRLSNLATLFGGHRERQQGGLLGKPWDDGMNRPNENWTAPGQPEPDTMRPVLVGSEDGQAPGRVQSRHDFVGADPKETEWFYRRSHDGIVPHTANEACHYFMRLKQLHAVGAQTNAIYYQGVLDINTRMTVEVLLDDNFPLDGGQARTGNSSVMYRSNNVLYMPRFEYPLEPRIQ